MTAVNNLSNTVSPNVTHEAPAPSTVLLGDPLQRVFGYLDARSLCSAVQVISICNELVNIPILCPANRRCTAGLSRMEEDRYARKHSQLEAIQLSTNAEGTDFCHAGCAGDHDKLWEGLAARKWPASTLRLSPYYRDHKVCNT